LNIKEIKEECGVFGVFAPGEDVSRLTYFGLHALQHRGQESAGITVSNKELLLTYKQLGLVTQVFSDSDLDSLKGRLAIGHVRYSTTGSTRLENAQPCVIEDGKFSLAVAHNGNILNSKPLRDKLANEGYVFKSSSDTEAILYLIHRNLRLNFPIEEAIARAMGELLGAYSLVIATLNQLIAVRDPFGIRPLALGKLPDGYVISSETCGLDIVGAELVREVQPGEIIVIDENGMFSYEGQPATKPSICMFEFIYFARPDSKINGKTLYEARKEMGRLLAKEAPADADIVIPVPDSGIPSAVGYAEASGIPFGEGLIKNRYVGRTFIQPTQYLRQLGIKLKLNPLKDIIAGKRVVLVDDSIVRGNTSRQIVQLIKDAGAREVHVRVSSPPVMWPCFYGIDTANRNELIAAKMSIESIRKSIGADSLVYLSLESLIKATGLPGESFCLACLNGEYPIEIPENLKLSKFVLEGSPDKESERRL
jgi:amidophosphoribosyltransferase